jgi:hypothetical protein
MNYVFFSWQADRSGREGRNLIEQALKDAIARIGDDATLESAVRENIELDKDTIGVAGSPPVLETILRKIDRAAAFVPDLTFVSKSDKGKLSPNPNVIMEYGWALKALGDSRIVPVMNTAYGDPKEVPMPFNLAHRRFPISYQLAEGAAPEERRANQHELAKELEGALRLVLKGTKNQTPPPDANRPRLGIKALVLSGKPVRGMIGAPSPEVEFSLRLLSGRPATSITIDAIPSAGGAYSLHLQCPAYLSEGESEKMGFEIWKNGERPSRRIIEASGWGRLLGEFLLDGSGVASYPITVRFMDRDEFRTQRFILNFDLFAFRFDVRDDISSENPDLLLKLPTLSKSNLERNGS